ncbi:hypothetical protein HPB50_005884 [Hyalomma asiaticum]|uniref:Uncharacterized protein n=1 Tax=Hyalomma asiaticum TaxID=266040 RepID=A0ACB7S9G8_HYAAI|nr:hypothetical protein HPB50_005884 [Hyalomma asiaticum]
MQGRWKGAQPRDGEKMENEWIRENGARARKKTKRFRELTGLEKGSVSNGAAQQDEIWSEREALFGAPKNSRRPRPSGTANQPFTFTR